MKKKATISEGENHQANDQTGAHVHARETMSVDENTNDESGNLAK